NPRVPTGREAFLALIPNLKKHNSKIENIRIFQDGDHAIMHHLWKNAYPFGSDQKAAFHVIRFDEEGLIAEHWNVMADITAPNPSGRTLLDGEREVKDLNLTEPNKQKITELFELLLGASVHEFEKIFSKFFSFDYHQHSPDLGDGIEAL